MNKNYLYNGDIFDLLKNIPDNTIDIVFGDPDYNVGIKYGQEQTTSYTTSFDEYIEWYIKLAQESLRVLKDTGNIFFVNYPKQNAYLRVKYLDNVCYDVQEYVWVYNSNVGHSPKRFTTAHRSILHCRKTKNNVFYKDNIALPYQNPNDKRIKRRIANGSKGRMPYSWFYFDMVKNISKEKKDHPCQLPQDMSEMLIKSCTNAGDLALILFAGSGAEIEICQQLGIDFLSAEIDDYYCDVMRQQLGINVIDFLETII